jgi:hypothetical protein
MERQMRTNFVRSDTAGDDEGRFRFLNWAIIVVAAGLLIAATSEFAPKQDAQTTVAHAPASSTVVETVTPAKT